MIAAQSAPLVPEAVSVKLHKLSDELAQYDADDVTRELGYLVARVVAKRAGRFEQGYIRTKESNDAQGAETVAALAAMLNRYGRAAMGSAWQDR